MVLPPPSPPSHLQVLERKAGAAPEAKLEGEPELLPCPFWDPETAEPGREPASMAFRYRRWKVAEGVTVIVRSVVHAISRRRGTPSYLNVFTLNEWDSKAAGTPDWRKTIDTQSTHAFAAEMKVNANKLSKFTIQALLAGTESMRIGMVSRVARTDASSHAVLYTMNQVPSKLAPQLGLDPANLWAILLWLVTAVRRQAAADVEAMVATGRVPDEESVGPLRYVLMRDPLKPSLKLFSVPTDDEEGAGEGEEGDEEGEEEGEEGDM